MDLAAEISKKIVRNPIASSSQRRYKHSIDLYEKWLKEFGVDLEKPDCSKIRHKDRDAVSAAYALILHRCGPKEHGFEGLQATGTGEAVKSAVVSYWRSKGINGPYVELPCGGFTGNPGKCSDLQILINRLDEAQRVARTNLPRRAYQETHEDIRSLFYTFVEPNLGRAMHLNSSVNYAELQAACTNIMQFSCIARGSEILSLKVNDLIFTSSSLDSPIVGVLPVTKSKRRSYTYFRFSKAVDISVCGLRALQGWLCVLRAHKVCNGNLFLQVRSNRLQGNTSLDGSTYCRFLGLMGERCGIQGLAEHSARRGGAGYHYYVLRRDLFFLYRAFSWDSLTEMLKYIGIEDTTNSYALLGFTAFGTNELYYSMPPNV